MINYNEYLEDIGIKEFTLKKRINEIISYASYFYNDNQLKDIFISDFINEDGSRNYTSLWLIYEDRICEAKNFITDIDLDSTHFNKNQVEYWNLKSKECLKDVFTDSDRLSVDIIFNENNLHGLFKAAKNNCSYLMKILKEYFC